ncbi:variable surface protein [Plasmodium gonderi]|uniref:Variable surface protein n=1 Tax=Plasmodium gonderi TaxID=77519 RepID=A0A1Y1JS34_PLAGO|nr:variable surface protein [Plasmodium gonderi]GAW84275.1 variable surface protein [Plasmodium gonderi]
MGGELFDNVLNNLPSKKMYAMLDDVNDSCEYDFVMVNGMNLIKTQKWITNTPEKIVNALCHIYDLNTKGKINSSYCDYLYYWLGDIIYKNIEYIINFAPVINVINFILKNNEGSSICNYDHYNIDREEFMDIKQLFDYSKDYNKLKEVTTNGSCSAGYKELLKKYAFIYSNFKLKCSKDPKRSKHCEYINKLIEGKDPKELSCNSPNNNYRSPIQQEHHNGVLESGVIRIQSRTSEQRQELPRSVVPADSYEDPNVQDLNHVLFEFHPSYIQAPHQSGIFDFSVSSFSRNIVIPPLVIGITVLPVILCKVIFTPVGYWLKKALVGKSKRKRNIIMDNNITEDYSMYENLESPRKFNLTYSNI